MALDQFTADNAGVPVEYIKPGLVVMVTTGAVSAAVNGHPTIIAFGVVKGPAGPANPDRWWVDVHATDGIVLPQMYRASEFLGIPSLGLVPPRCSCGPHDDRQRLVITGAAAMPAGTVVVTAEGDRAYLRTDTDGHWLETGDERGVDDHDVDRVLAEGGRFVLPV